MGQIMTYGSLTKIGNGRGPFVQVSEPELHTVLRSILAHVEVNEGWYRQVYGDVDEAIEKGEISSARAHYISAGYFEGRFPREVNVDETWYLKTYADVALAIRKGKFSNAQEHFETDGFKEGRLAHDGWTL